MTKKELIKYISDRYEWFERMQKPLGHNSWWYTNRNTDDCIDVKIYAGADIDELKTKISPATLSIIEKLHINLDEWLEDKIWGDFGFVDMARDDLQTELKEKYNVDSLDCGGKSGGWLCVVFNWDYIPDDFDTGEYTAKELEAYKKIIDEAETENATVNSLIVKRKMELCRAIEDVENYTDELEEYADEQLETEQIEARRILSIKNI